MKRFTLAISLLLCVLLALAPISIAAPDVPDTPAAPDVSAAPSSSKTLTDAETAALMTKMIEIMNLIYDNGLDSGGNDDPMYNALFDMIQQDPAFYDKFMESMLSHYDEHSHYIPTGMYDLSYPSSPSYAGVGISINASRKDGLFIEEVVEGGPAALAGLKSGDQLIKIDAKDVEFSHFEELIPLLRGEAGTSVTVTVRRAGALKTFAITRKVIPVSNVAYSDLGDGVGYIRISGFGNLATFVDFADTYNSIPYDGIKSVIIDLRDNPGGDMSILNAMLDYATTKKGEKTYSIQIQSGEKIEFTSKGLASWTPNKLLVLINENTASAAEIFAGALCDLGYAESVGVNTYGKDCGQAHLVFDDNSAAVITTLKMTLPKTGAYGDHGLTPKHIAKLALVDYPMPAMEPLDITKPISSASGSKSKLALEQRLHELGYHYAEPDDVFDGDTIRSIKAFQRDFKLTLSAVADTSTLKALADETAKLKASKVTADTQLELAVKMASEAAKKPLASPLPPRGEVDFSKTGDTQYKES